jgi:hypothetical protein
MVFNCEISYSDKTLVPGGRAERGRKISLCVCVYVCMYVCIYVYVCVYMCVFMYVCICMYVRVSVCVYGFSNE